MSNWFTRLFARKGLIGQRVHAWHYSQYGRARIVGEVVDETETSLVLDISNEQDYKGFRHVWKHDARPLNENLPDDITAFTKTIGT